MSGSYVEAHGMLGKLDSRVKIDPRAFIVLVCYAALLALARTLVHARMVDIEFDDESGYLKAGLDFIRSGPPRGEESPLYALWYWLESCVVFDPVNLYYANWGILLFATLLATATALSAMEIDAIGVLFAMSVVSVLSVFELWPHVTLLSGILVLVAATMVIRIPSAARALSTGSTALAFAAFVRPELFQAFALYFVVSAFASLRERQVRYLVIPLVTIGVLCVTFGLPFGGGRTMVAFGQHYAFNVVNARHLNIDSWNNWTQLVRADFGDVSTPFGSLLANWRAFAWHIGANIRNLPINAYVVMPFLPSSVVFRALLGLPLAVVLTVGISLGIVRARRDERALRLVALSGALMVPWALSALIIAPRVHYFVAPFMALFTLAVYGVGNSRFARIRTCMLVVVPLAPLLIGVAGWVHGQTTLSNVATVRLLRTLALPPGIVILEPDFGRGLYAMLKYERLSQTDCMPFAPCLQTRSPDVIVSDKRLRSYYANDAGFQAFARRSGASDFEDKVVAGTDIHVYVRRATASANRHR
jgi:hypothetical protein